ncbi:hypothetical protein GCM10017687_10880 [Streptomyces echinatus]
MRIAVQRPRPYVAEGSVPFEQGTELGAGAVPHGHGPAHVDDQVDGEPPLRGLSPHRQEHARLADRVCGAVLVQRGAAGPDNVLFERAQ